jgi:HSP20 family protein
MLLRTIQTTIGRGSRAVILPTRTNPLRGFNTMRAHYMPRNMLTPQLYEGPLSGVAQLLDKYEHMLAGHPGLHVQTFSPFFDIRETEDAYHLDGELPGVQQKNLDIEFEDSHRLNIKGRSEHESTSEKGSWLVSERSIGGFQRTFNFPCAVDEENAQARLKNGVLSMTVPKKVATGVAKKVTVEE